MLQGIDVSYAQGAIDWSKVPSSGISFAYAKASEGQTLVDERFAENYSALGRSSIKRGAYHFMRFRTDPAAQADNFLRVANPQKGDLVPMVDVEVSDGVSLQDCATRLSAFLKVVEKRIGRFMLIYTSYGFWNYTMGGYDGFSGHPLWIAEYNSDPEPTMPNGWRNWTIWQHSDAGRVAGIAGNVDMNKLNGDRDALDALVLE